MYGIVKKFCRVICSCPKVYDFVLVTWLPRPVYPDTDPLTVRINVRGLDVNNIPNIRVISINDIQPSRVLVDIDQQNICMYMMRMEGLDTIQ